MGYLDNLNDLGPLKPDILNEIQGFYAYVARDRVDLWIDGDNGDDENRGFTSDTAVKTIHRLKRLIPNFIQAHYFIIHMRGTIEITPGTEDPDSADLDFANTLIFKTVGDTLNDSDSWVPPVIIIQGDTTTRTTVLDNGSGGNLVTTASAVSQITVGGSAWSTNEWKGYWIDFKSGPLNGLSYAVVENDSDTLYLLFAEGDPDPGVGTEFIITRPSTVLHADGYPNNRNLECILHGPGKMYISHLYFDEGASINFWAMGDNSHAHITLSNLIVYGGGGGWPPKSLFGFVSTTGGFLYFDDLYFDCTGATPVAVNDSYLGVSWHSDPFFMNLFLFSTGNKFIKFSLLPKTSLWNCSGDFLLRGSKAKQINMMDSWLSGHGGSAGFDDTARIGGDAVVGALSQPALTMINSACDAAELILENAEYGARLVNSTLTMVDVSGVGLTTAGVYATGHSYIPLTDSDTTPTVDKSGGGCQLTIDGTTEASTWAAIRSLPATGSIDCDNAGTAVIPADTETFVLDDGVNPAVTYEFDTNASVVETPTLRQVDISAAATDDDVRDAIIDAIDNTPTLDIVADDDGDGLVYLENTRRDAAGNVAITETVAGASFVVTGMAGGSTSVPVADPQVVCDEYTPDNFNW